MRRNERIERIQHGLKEAQLDAIVCALPSHVLLLSGYWPVTGASIGIATSEGRVFLLVPDDEEELAQSGWADAILKFQPASPDDLRSILESVSKPLAEAAKHLGITSARIGYENGAASEPASYVAMYLYGASMLQLLGETLPSATLESANSLLANLAAIKTSQEIECIRATCRIAEKAFAHGASGLRVGLKETEVAVHFRLPLSIEGTGIGRIARADGFMFCMSGQNAAEAGGAYARSRARPLRNGDLVLVHCNSYADGYWSDITRTYVLGQPNQQQRKIYDAVFEARQAALAAIRPGIAAGEVDRAARGTLTEHGFGKEFKHATGHGVGFAAISHDARPRIHSQSEELLETGMVFNVEPAIYRAGFGGIRHCDMVAVTENGVELLTPFQPRLQDLIISPNNNVATDIP